MVSIKTNFEIPRGDDPQGLQLQGQRLSQDLSTNFKAIASMLSKIPNQNSLLNIILPVGSIIHSMLTLSQFQSLAGNGWILADGQSCAGSVYEVVTGASTVPDVTGRVLRGQGSNNPDGVLPLGTYQADEVIGHTHSIPEGTNNTGGPVALQTATISTTESTSSYGGNETRMKNITVNIFIKIN